MAARLKRFERPIKFVISGSTGALVQLGILKFCTDKLHIYYMFSAVIALGFAMFVNYLLNNFWTFKQKSLV